LLGRPESDQQSYTAKERYCNQESITRSVKKPEKPISSGRAEKAPPFHLRLSHFSYFLINNCTHLRLIIAAGLSRWRIQVVLASTAWSLDHPISSNTFGGVVRPISRGVRFIAAFDRIMGLLLYSRMGNSFGLARKVDL
jgi:hypothetical protein